LNAANLQINQANITRFEAGEQNETLWTAVAVSEDAVTQQITLRGASGEFASGLYALDIAFSGNLTESLHGYYRSSYLQGNETHWMAVSNFEPTDARRAFPCFDEPAMKATFQVNLKIKKGLTALSNTPVNTTTAIDEDTEVCCDELFAAVLTPS
jgi:aminopeptidase N